MMRNKKAYSQINQLVGLAPLVLFLSSYMPLFVLIIVRQLINNLDYLSWSGLSIDTLLCMIKYFGMSIMCTILIIVGLLGTYWVFKNLEHKVENGHTYTIKELSSMNDEPLAYIATYIIPIMFENYTSLTDCLTVACIFYVIYRLYIRSKLLLVNPMLSLRYSIYHIKYVDGDIERQGILISKCNEIIEGEQVKIYNVGLQLFYGYKR